MVNVLAPALLSLLLLPNLRAAAAASSSRPGDAPKPHLSIVSSGLYEMAKFPERNLPSGERLNALNDSKRYVQSDRYPTSKVINLLWVRELASRVSNEGIIVNAPTPGFCKTELMRDTSGVMGLIVKLTMLMVGREASDGARCIVEAATVKEEDSHGRFLSEMKIKAETAMVTDEEGEKLQKDMWKEIMDVFAREGLLVQVT
ncbi:short-chain dehydrogenase reductase protein [Rutstroemia sp. NJR-2017a BVV2]|nr:short-chain dehydrogenase reductase protein [Rutstroemia sp. NJR-2017a BVV2]